MARINNYIKDDIVEPTDIVIGTEKSTGKTKNYSIDSIRNFFVTETNVGGVIFKKGNHLVSGEFTANSNYFSGVTEFKFNKTNTQGDSVIPIFNTLKTNLVNNRFTINVEDSTNQNRFILAKILNIIDNDTFFTITLDIVKNVGNGELVTGNNFSIEVGLYTEAIDGTKITTVTSNKVGNVTTVTVNGDFDNAPLIFEILDGDATSGVDWSNLLNRPISFPPSAHTHTISDVTSLQSNLDGKVGKNANIVAGTKTKITYDVKGLVTAGADATTADIADSLNKRYVTDADLVDIGNLSGVNTGDQNLSGYELLSNKQNSLATDGTGTKYPTVDAVNAELNSINTDKVPYTGALQDVNLGAYSLLQRSGDHYSELYPTNFSLSSNFGSSTINSHSLSIFSNNNYSVLGSDEIKFLKYRNWPLPMVGIELKSPDFSTFTSIKRIYWPSEAGTIALLTDIPQPPIQYLSEIAPDSYIGQRLQPLNPTSNGFFISKSINGNVGMYAENSDDIGNEAVANFTVKGSGDVYTNTFGISFQGNGYWIPYLRSSGLLYTDKKMFIVATGNNDVDIRTGLTLDIATSKLNIKNTGEVIATNLTTALITAEATGRTVITKEYLDNRLGNTGTGFELTSNKVTSLSGASTDVQYPSAKLTYDQLALKENVANKQNSLTFDGTGVKYPTVDAITAPNIPAARLGNSTFTSVQHIQDLFHSAGWTSGGVITNAGGGLITVSAGTGLIRAINSDVATIYFTDFPASTPANVVLVDGSQNYIYVEYNGGTPRVIATTIQRADYNTSFLIGAVYRVGTTLHINSTVKTAISDHAGKMIAFNKEVMPYARANGSMISEVATRGFAITAGTFWNGLVRFTTNTFSTATGSFFYFYRNGVGGWTKVPTQTQINNTQFDNGTGALATLSNNKYGIHWVFIDTDGDTYVVYGQGDYTLIEAQNKMVPSSLPVEITSHGFVVGKIIIQKSLTTFAQIESAFAMGFSSAMASEHNSLAGLQGGAAGDYQHLTATQATIATQEATNTLSGYVSAGTQTFGGVKTFTLSPIVPTPTTNTQVTNKSYVDAKVADTITDGITTIAPSQNAVFDALALKEDKLNKNQINGYAGLDGSGKINPLQLPALAITDTFVVASQVAMLALVAETGDVAVRTDLSKSFILKGSNPTLLADWQELLTPTDAVQSIFGRSGTVTAQANDYNADQILETATRVFVTPTEKTAITHSNRTALDLVSGSNKGDQTSIVGITGTKAQFDTAVTDGNFMYIGDAPTAHTHDYSAVFAPINGSANYIQASPASAQSANMWISGSGRIGDLVFNGNGIALSPSSGYVEIANNYSGKAVAFGFYNGDGLGTKIANISNTGAATFASTVTASNGQLIGGTGTINYIPKFTGAGSLGNSAIFESGGNVGIGTVSPSQKLTLLGGNFAIRDTDNANDVVLITADSNFGYLQLRANSIERIRLSAWEGATSYINAGNVLIGTTTDNGAKLQVNGDFTINNVLNTSSLYVNTTGTGVLLSLNKNNSQLFSVSNNGSVVSNGAATFSGGVTAQSFITPQGGSYTDGYITWGTAQINRYGSNIELQFIPTAGSTVKIGAGGSNPIVFDAVAGTATFASTIQATTAKLTNLTDGYLPYHISDASGLGNSPVYTDGSNVGIGSTTTLVDNLHLSTNTVYSQFRLSGTDVVPGGGFLTAFSSNASVFSGLILSSNRSVSSGTFIDVNKSHAEINVISQNANSYISFRTGIINNEFSSERMRLIGSGNVGIGYSTGTEITNNRLAVNGSGYFNGSVTTTDLIGSSDITLKENIQVLQPKKINSNYKTFNFIGNDQDRIGVIAQELELTNPEFVRTDDKGIKSVSYTDLHSCEIAYLKDKIEKLEELVNKLIK